MFLSIFEFKFLYFLKSVGVYQSQTEQVSAADAPSSSVYYRGAIIFSIEGVCWGPGGRATGDILEGKYFYQINIFASLHYIATDSSSRNADYCCTLVDLDTVPPTANL